jgi:hypothetical protein
MNDLEQKAERLRAELKEVEKQIADAESHYPEKGTNGYVLYFDGIIHPVIFENTSSKRGVFDQGNWFDTKYEAELTRNYRAAVARINRAIRNGDKGTFVPFFNENFGWHPSCTGSQSEFAGGLYKTIEKVLLTHKADFDVIAEYRKVMLA